MLLLNCHIFHHHYCNNQLDLLQLQLPLSNKGGFPHCLVVGWNAAAAGEGGMLGQLSSQHIPAYSSQKQLASAPLP